MRDKNGKVVQGSLAASDADLVVAKLREMGYVPISVTAKSRSGLNAKISFGTPKVKLRDLVVFSRQAGDDDQRRPVTAAGAHHPR